MNNEGELALCGDIFNPVPLLTNSGTCYTSKIKVETSMQSLIRKFQLVLYIKQDSINKVIKSDSIGLQNYDLT